MPIPQYTIITDVFMEPVDDLSAEHAALAAKAAATARAVGLEKLQVWQSACENCCAALDENGRPGFLLFAAFVQDRPPSAHRLLELHASFARKPGLQEMVYDYLKPEERFDFMEGPAILAFIPGIETLHKDIEHVYDQVWAT